MRSPESDARRTALREDFEVDQLIQALALSARFHLYIVVCDDPRWIHELVGLLRDVVPVTSGRSTYFEVLAPYATFNPLPRPDEPDGTLDAVSLSLIESEYESPSGSSERRVWILDASAAPERDDTSWARLFARLNEQRNQVLRRLQCPLVMCLPSRLEPLFARAAPDFWSVRSRTFRLSLVLPERPVVRSPFESLEALRSPIEYTNPLLGNDLPQSSESSAVALVRRARALLDHGALDAALRASAEGVAARRESLSRDRTDPRRLRALSSALNLHGDVHRASGDLDGAARAYAESESIRRQLLSDAPVRDEARRDLAVVLTKRGGVDRARGDLSSAERAYAESLTIRRALVAESPGDPERLRDLSVSLERIGDVARERGDLAEAVAPYKESLAIRRRLLAREPRDEDRLFDLAIVLNRVGDLARERGDLVEAQAVYTESLTIRRQLLRHSPAQPDRMWSVVVGLRKLGDLATDRADFESAQRSLAEATTLAMRLVALDDARPAFRHELALEMVSAARLAEAEGDVTRARTQWEVARQTLAPLLTRATPDVEWINTDRLCGEALARLVNAVEKPTPSN